MDVRYLAATLLVIVPPIVTADPLTTALDPLATVERVNRNYNTVDNQCREPDTGAPRGHYYCSGVTLRMVDDGPFNPWDYSDYAQRTGATSFSWIRKDLSTNRLIRPAGFILRTPMDARALNLPVMETGFVCLYTFDGFTGPERKWYGCGRYNKPLPDNFQKHSGTTPANRNQHLAYGSCDSMGVDNADQWHRNYRYARTDMNRIQVTQCSWNVEQPSDWNAMIHAHENPRTVARNLLGREVPARDNFARKEALNEMLLRNASDSGDGSARLPYIDAVVWDVNSTYAATVRGAKQKAKPVKGLEPARNFQRKLYAQGYAVPVLRLDFTKPASQRFSYAPEDQVVTLGHPGEPEPSTPGKPAANYIKSAQWVLRLDPGTGRQEWTLSVVPTAAGKASQLSDQQAVYDELVKAHGNDPQWRDHESSTGSMREQLACLVANYPKKDVWNLEPFRPNVGASEAAKAGCNPYVAQSSSLIASSRWSQFRDQDSGELIWGLRVVPSEKGRAASQEALYDELLRLRGKDVEWQEGGEGSMRVQLACLQANYRNKATWNLEPHRPAVSAEQAKAQGCNPT
ncbi:DUF2599 domain-containing protein [Pseudomonas putida]|uniref:DUF2599 domain-containing protein n=1 Tax=Pseudomonas putida TaxID=303 RepID=A0A4D6X868_PSEPU|nr:DUF2599 domain-containing protein [Pseudomonas putida]QCI12272.1 DUF2599 domain-containing protein [Pseudomonas putida]